MSFLRHHSPILALALCLLLAPAAAFAAEGSSPVPPPADHDSIARLGLHGNVVSAGAEVSDTLATATGMAVSPLIGVSGIGVYAYFSTPEEQRGNLPWWAHPYCWGTGLALVGFSFMRDSIGASLPVVVRKPLQILDSIEDKVSALVAGLAVTPSLYYVGEAFFIQQGWLGPAADPEMMVASAGLDLSGDGLTRALLAAGSVAAFGVVWLVSHAVNILVVLSPFRIVDVALKTFKFGFLAAYVALAYYVPELRLVLAGGLILLCLVFFGWAYRLNAFGTVMAWDFLRKVVGRSPELEGDSVGAFSTRALEGVPSRSYGRLRAEPGTRHLNFRYRRLPFFPRRTVEVSGEGDSSVVQRGLVLPGLVVKPAEQAAEEGEPEVSTAPRRLFHFRLAARGQEEAIAEILHRDEVRDIVLLRGIRSAWVWCRQHMSRSTDGLITAAKRTRDRLQPDPGTAS